MENRKTIDIQKKFYNTYQPDYLAYAKNIPYAKYLVATMLEVMPDNKTEVLEIGAGQGRFTFELAKFVRKLTACDISQKEIGILTKLAKRLKLTNIKSYITDLLTLEHYSLPQKYDHIVGFFILHHLPKEKYFEVVDKLQFFLKKGGRFIFIEPNNLYPFHLVEMMIEKEMKWEVEKGIYSNYISCFKKACRDLGLRQINSTKFGFIPPPIINIYPPVTFLDKVIESVPIVNQIFCPFILLSFEKP